jgi:hypothetical protein
MEETSTMKAYVCPTCGAELMYDGTAYRCERHGMWYSYGANLLVLGPSDEHKLRDRFMMPWESRVDPR